MAMRLKSLFLVVTATVAGLGLLLVLSIMQLQRANTQLKNAEETRYQSYLLADELRQSSDDLTRLARTYVVSGDPRWEKQYFEVLDIRNGKKPRPLGYEKIYWDFLAADRPSPRGMGQAVPLQELMRQAGFTEAEFAKLKQAQANSDGLVKTETIAMNMVKGLYDDGQGGFTRRGEPDLEQARRLMHDAQYHAFKADIMKPVDEFLVLLDERTGRQVEMADRSRQVWFAIAATFALALAVVAVLCLLLVRRIVFRALGDEPAAVTDVLTRMAAGRLDGAARLMGSPSGSVLHQLGKTMQELASAIEQVRSGAAQLNEASDSLSAATRQLSDRSTEQRGTAEAMARSVEQLVGSVTGVSERAGEAHEAAAQARGQAQQGEGVIREVVNRIGEISVSVKDSAQEIESMKSRSAEISSIIQVINEIAARTNLLALNAAIEAARAGEQGRGFSVVADEVRKLAEQTRGSTDQIATMLSEVLSATERTANLMSESVDRVQIGVAMSQQVGAAVAQIQAGSQAVEAAIAHISRALQEQASSGHDLTGNVVQVSRLSEDQMATALQNRDLAERLAGLSRALQQSMSRFVT